MDLKKEINKARKILNREILISDNITEDLINKSKELDLLIVNFYNKNLLSDD